jgi:TIR domain
MTDIFLSYSSADLDRVRPIRDRLAEQGFDVFWDQKLPPGIDWDTWIRQHLTKSKCAVIVWSKNSVKSDNVRHEAMIAKQKGKFLPVLIDELDVDEFPMGLQASQGAKLVFWSGDPHDDVWVNLLREIEDRLTPAWVKQGMDRLEAGYFAEQTRREAAEKRNKALRDQIEIEARTQADLKHERDIALEEITTLKEQLASAAQHSASLEEQLAKTIRERDLSLEKLAAKNDELGIVTDERNRALEERDVAIKKRDLALQRMAKAKEEASRKPPPPPPAPSFIEHLGQALQGMPNAKEEVSRKPRQPPPAPSFMEHMGQKVDAFEDRFQNWWNAQSNVSKTVYAILSLFAGLFVLAIL